MMKKVPEHVAVVMGAGDAAPRDPGISAARSVLLSARQSGVRYLTLVPETGSRAADIEQAALLGQALRSQIDVLQRQAPSFCVQIVAQSGRRDIALTVRKLAALVKSR